MTVQPNFFIVGAAKSGTSSLFYYLEQHPDIFMSPIKEPHYFCHEDFPPRFTGPGDEGFSDNRVRSFERYLELFQAGESASIRGEGSVYYICFPGVAERLYKFNADSKIIIILRNPVERAFSAYMHTVRDGRETLSFEKALEAEEIRRQQGFQPLWWYRELGLYSSQVERYMRVFPPNQLKIYLFEDLRDMQKVIQDALQFLGVDESFKIDTSIRHNESGVPKSRFFYSFFAYPNVIKEIVKPLMPRSFRQRLGQKAKSMTLRKESMNVATRRMLENYYREDLEKLQDLLQRDLSDWLR